jgi:predicted lipid carrier protein YhbT
MHLAGRLPLLPLEIVVRRLVTNALAARPSLLTRLGEHAAGRFAIDPVDCPFAFLITPGVADDPVRVVRNLDDVACDARIAAPLVVLLGLLDGSYDGDALFFSRDLVIEGDTEAVLALRNAIENAGLDPSTVAGLPVRLHSAFNGATAAALSGLRRVLGAPEPTILNDGST